MSSQDQTDPRDRSRSARQQWILAGSSSNSTSSHRISGSRSNNNSSRNSSDQLQAGGLRNYNRKGHERDGLQCEVATSSRGRPPSVKRWHIADEGERLKKRKTILTCACRKTSIPPPLPSGTIPSCQRLCFVPRPCGHQSSHKCHSGDCPPCTVPVAKECVGGHEVLRSIPCASKGIQCSSPCGKTMQCGIHACGRACHAPPCDSSCGQICGVPRRNCNHTCTAICHPSTPCPASRFVVCKTITCSCGRVTATVTCDFVATGQRKLACDDECAEAERRRELVDASDISQPNMDALRGIFRRFPEWVTSVDERCKNLVLGEDSLNFFHVFHLMGILKNDAVKLIAEKWKLTFCDAKSFMVVHVTAKSEVIADGSAGLNPPLYDPRIDMDPRRVVALLNLSNDSDIDTLASRFRRDYELVWLNGNNAVVVFGDQGRADTAMRRLAHGSVYRGASVVRRSSSAAGSRASGSNPSV